MSRRGRPRRDRIERLREILAKIEANPTWPPQRIARDLHARDADVYTVFRCLRQLEERRIPDPRPGRPKNPVPNSQRGVL